MGAAHRSHIVTLVAGRTIARREREASLATIRETARVSLQAALELRRAGANERMADFLPRLESAYRQALNHAPENAEVEYLMGRFHRALNHRAVRLAGPILGLACSVVFISRLDLHEVGGAFDGTMATSSACTATTSMNGA